MKYLPMIIFFTVFLTIYFFGNLFIFNRGVKAFEGLSHLSLYKWTFWILALSFVVGQILERGEPTITGKIVTHIGSIWLSVLLYILLSMLVTDIVRSIDYFFPFLPEKIYSPFTNARLFFSAGLIIAAGMTIYGLISARMPKTHIVDVTVNKTIPDMPDLKIVMVSDIHMGAMIANGRIKKMIESINELQPDLVLFAGDLVDHNPLYVKADEMGKHFLKLKPRLGVYAVTGNHEYIGHPEISVEYLQQFGIRYVRDTMIDIGNNILIAGRDDKDKVQFAGSPRKKLQEVIPGKADDKFVILMDHQPVDYSEAERLGVDLMVSGHTHKGQVWPFGYITSMVYENDYGLMKKGNTNFYTSSGYGTWGPPVRTGYRPEIVVINVKFGK